MISRLQDLLTRSAQRDPDRTALVLGDQRLSYGYLESLTNQLARLQQAHGITAGSRVCVVAAKTPATIAGLLATLKAGGSYVPIDSASPAARVARIVDAAEPSLVLADSSATGLLDDLIGTGGLPAATPIGALGPEVAGTRFEAAFTLDDAARMAAGPVHAPGGGSEIAHLLFTSGSTGVPKGVMITHDNVGAFVDWALGYVGFRPGDRISGHPPLHFDLSTFDIYGALAAGAELHLVPAELNVNPRALAAFIRDHELTQWFSVPSVLTYMAKFDVVRDGDFPALERLLWCGEVLPTAVLMQWMRRLPGVRFTNLYGPTEATIASSFYTVPACPADETEPVPIGTACTGEELLVLDEHRQPVPDGEIGDLYIAGTGLSPGYWRDEDKTAAAFLPDPRDPGARIYRTGDLARYGDDGLVYFLGRADSQIKSRGYRIELGEVEAAVNAVPGVRECAVVGVETGGFEGTTICCAFSVLDGAELAPPELRRRLAAMLPPYMVPARWRQLVTLPKNVNGKIDRKDLRDRFGEDFAQPAATRKQAAS
jgi:amino acid adenylation domain-containing protein